jgi:hypothetical protein
MADVAAPVLVLPGGAPAGAVTPQLPHGADPGTITGWLLDITSTETSESISTSLECCFDWLVNNIPVIYGPGYDEAMQAMKDEVISSDMLVTYLVTTNIGNNVVRIIFCKTNRHD